MADDHTIVGKAEALATSPVLHPAVEKLLDKDPTPETLEKILNLQREWEKDQARKEFTRAMVEMKKTLPAFLHRDKTVKFSSVHYTHTSLASAMQTVTPILNEHGFTVQFFPATDDRGKVSVTARLTHRGGHSDETTISADADKSGSKSASQGVASTITLLQRYTLLSILGLATADMKDPEPPDDGGGDKADTVDTQRNMKAVTAIIKKGKTKKEAEEFVQRSVEKWTSTDLDKLRKWLKPETAGA